MFFSFNPFKLEFTIVIFIHYKPRIALAILDLVDEDDFECVANEENILLLLKQFHETFHCKIPRF